MCRKHNRYFGNFPANILKIWLYLANLMIFIVFLTESAKVRVKTDDPNRGISHRHIGICPKDRRSLPGRPAGGEDMAIGKDTADFIQPLIIRLDLQNLWCSGFAGHDVSVKSRSVKNRSNGLQACLYLPCCAAGWAVPGLASAGVQVRPAHIQSSAHSLHLPE